MVVLSELKTEPRRATVPRATAKPKAKAKAKAKARAATAPSARVARATSCGPSLPVRALPPMGGFAPTRPLTPPNTSKLASKPRPSRALRAVVGLELGSGARPLSRPVSQCSTRTGSESHSDSDPGSPKAFPSQASARSAARGPVTGGSVLIFDWDDTLLPTTAIRAQRSQRGQPLSFEDTQAHAELVERVLRTARAAGHVSIVTLSKNNWVARSAQMYLPALDMPALMEELGITVYYAQDDEKTCPGALAAEDWQTLKHSCMERCLNDWRCGEGALSAHVFKPSVMSVGDSDAEQGALKALIGAQGSDRPLCKTVKLMDEPSLDELSHQLQELLMWFERMVLGKNDFDLYIDCPSVLAARARALSL